MKNIFFIMACLLFISSCSKPLFKASWTKETAPEFFKATFETTKGSFQIEAHRQWSPKAVDRLYQLIHKGAFTNIAIYRVIPNFVAQFGMQSDTLINTKWQSYKVPDEPVIKSNDSGTVAFARAGVNSRSNDIYINLKDNHRLDTIAYNDVKGFPVIAVVVSGMKVVQSFYNTYKEEPMEKAQPGLSNWNNYFKANYPKLDYINKAYIVK